MLPVNTYTSQIIVLEVSVRIEVEADQDCDDLGIRHHALSTPLRSISGTRKCVFCHLISNSLQKSSAIQKNSVTLLSVIMIQYLLFDTSKLLNISEITKRIGNFFKLPIQLFYSISYPELA